jgi:hypothetical protein
VEAPAAGTGEGCVHVRLEDGKILKPSAKLESGEVWLSVLRGVRWGISGESGAAECRRTAPGGAPYTAPPFFGSTRRVNFTAHSHTLAKGRETRRIIW